MLPIAQQVRKGNRIETGILPLFRHSQHGHHLLGIIPHVREIQLLHLELEEWLDTLIKHLFPLWRRIAIHDAFEDEIMHTNERSCWGKPSNLTSNKVLMIQECKEITQVDKVLQNVVCAFQICWKGHVDPILCLA